jgi:hypothetical protein
MPLTMPEIPIVYFHSIAPQKNHLWVRKHLTFELVFFEAFLHYLKKHNWDTIFLDEYYKIKISGKKPRSKICCITFDDGLLDNFIYVFPLLKKFGFKGTIFVNPEFVDLKRNVAKTMEDVWIGNSTLSDIDQLGYLSWDELRIMQQSGVVDVQSHTLTHTKYFVSDELVTFHRPGADCLYPVGNLFPERKPYYINDTEFDCLIPYGTPLFKESSSVIARRVFINKAFDNLVIEMLTDFQWKQFEAVEKAFKRISTEYQSWKSKGKIIESRETDTEYKKRLYDEIVVSKNIIEAELLKKVEFLCWPHGDNNEFVHQYALGAGYLATTTGSKQQILPSSDRLSIRFSIGIVKNNVFLTNLKTFYRMSLASGNNSMKLIQTIFSKLN